MDILKAQQLTESIAQTLIDLRAALMDAPAPPTVTVVKAGDNLQAALDQAGSIELEAGAVFQGTYTFRSNTTLKGNAGSAIRGATGPAILIPPGTSRVFCSDFEVTSKHPEVVRMGENTSAQTSTDAMPVVIAFRRVKTPSHRGKRVYAIHAAGVTLEDCEVLETWDPAGSDSQAIYIGNSLGDIKVLGGRYSAGSEIFLSGGDTYAMPNVTPTDILVDGVELFRPLEWMTDGVARKVKNIFEIKNGRKVRLEGSTLHGCWANGQQGEAIVLTPALDGAKTDPPKQSGDVADVLIQSCQIYDCSSVFNLLGRQYSAYTPQPLRGVVVNVCSATVNRAKFGGRGQLAMIGGEPEDIAFNAMTIVNDGTSLVYYSPGTVLDPVTKLSRPAGRIKKLSLTHVTANLGSYGLMLNGYANGANWQQSVEELTVTGNSFSGPSSSVSAMKKAFPENTYTAV